MRCISPLLVRNNQQRNFVPCGKCNFCLQAKRADWSFRLAYEAKKAKTAYFITLTYEDENLPLNPKSGLPEVRKDELQLLFKRIRKFNRLVVPDSLRYYSVGEYGTLTSRPHYHSIMFNMHEQIVPRLDRLWDKGMIHVGEVTDASIHYVTKYVINRTHEYAGREPPFALMSRRPGLGAGYVNTHQKWHKADMRNYTEVHGLKRRIPRYLKDQLFSKLDRSLLTYQAANDLDIYYWDQLEKLSKYHPDPAMYYDECLFQSHDKVIKNLNSKNQF